MNYNAFRFGPIFVPIFSPILVPEKKHGNRLFLQDYRPRKSIIIDLFSLFLNAGVFLPSAEI